MTVPVELSAVLSKKNTDYNLFLLLWKVYRLKDGKIVNNHVPIVRKFGSTIKANLKPGEYALTYQLGASTGEHMLSIAKGSPWVKKQFDLNSGVINVEVLPTENAEPHPDCLVICRQREYVVNSRWILFPYPNVVRSGEDLVLPANVKFALEAEFREADPARHSEEKLVNINPGEIRSLTFITDKVGYR